MRSRAAVRVVGPLYWIGYPMVVCVVLTVLLSSTVRILHLPLPEPILPMVLAFSWPLIRPSMLGPAMLFVIGMFEDLYLGTPLGLWTLALLGVYGAVLSARAFIIGQDTRVLLAWWVGSVSAAFVFAYLFVMLDVKVAASIIAVLLQLVPTLLLFPVANILVQRFDDGDVRFR